MNADFNRFHNALRILVNLGQRDLEDAGVIDRSDHDDWERFARNPYRFFYAISTPRAEKLWALIEKRQPASLRSNLHPIMAEALAPFVDAPK